MGPCLLVSRPEVMRVAVSETDVVRGIRSDYEYGFSVPEDYFFKSGRGLSHELVEAISEHKSEPEWMRKFRHKSLDYFLARPMPSWGPDLSGIDFANIYYYIRPTEKQASSWEELPPDIKDTWDRLGIPEAEKKYLAGVGAQYESEVVYHKLQADLEAKGVIFLDMDSGLREHEELVKQYFGTIIPQNDNKFAALNSAVWSGGSFIYVPPGVRVEMPLQAYFRINAENMGQFERTLIIVDENAYVHYVEGCHLGGSMVRVRDGEKPIEEVEIGDEVLTHEGRFRRVRDTMPRRFEGPIFRITFAGEGYRSLAVTPRHPFLVATRKRAGEHNTSFEPEWKEAWELRKGDYLAVLASIDAELEPFEVWGENVLLGSGNRVPVAERVELELSPTVARKADVVIADGYLWMPIRSIEETQANCTVYNLSVQDDESYVCEGVISHNCTAPIYSSDSLHSAVVEIIVKKGGRHRYTTIQNWSNNVYNLVTKRAVAYENATMEWVDGNLGSKITTKYPSVWLMGEGAHGEVLSIAFAGKGQHQDAGGKVIHVAPRTSSVITSKSISKDGGRAGYRGLLQVAKGAHGSRSKVVCDALILDDESRSDTYPYIQVDESDVDLGHEATVSKIGEEQLFYLMSRGLSEAEASAMIVSGFVEPITKELPLEYAVEMNRLIELQMEGSVG